MKKLLLTIPFILISGCSTTPNPKVSWIADMQIDEFTDHKVCSVTTGSYYSKNNVYTYTNHLYPTVDIVNGDIRVGVKSGGKYKVPVGDVQLRIYDNTAWKISTSETPLDYIDSLSSENPIVNYDALPEESRALMEKTYKGSMELMSKAMSPVTVTTGEKAQKILNEMLSGTAIKYRTLGLNQAASSTGEFKLDNSLKESLLKCGVRL